MAAAPAQYIATGNIHIDGALGYTKGDPVANDVIERYGLEDSVEKVKPAKVEAETPAS